ncbi:telomere repeat binding factor-domain-containing protein [Annulohypoxylon maeteangense]|uniref:telomere repeat binding factor-domain-containing protein n=1 Tax=Annulohypoxylon maeteangense TaxID=1927788 RepID=UPI0020082312|nr:telomere repeat binding factor-domain-containing protein [Annulohypoxylon maeteangense]KAI0884963.1 telomere repeat binding factor-domain-containing protein [Annulohypoxylon maeteangense]
MADVAEAIAAAIAAAAPLTSPDIKAEPSNHDAMILDPAPEQPQSPVKRPRTPDDGGEQTRDEKRPKIETKVESDGANEMDELALLVQQAQAEAMQQFHLEPDRVDGLPSNEHEHEQEHVNAISHEIPDLEPTFEQQAPTPAENSEPRPESLWSNPRDFTRRKHIIPGLGSLAIDIITAWSEQSLEDTVATLSGDPESDIAKEYAVLKTAFDAQRNLLSDTHTLLYPEQLNVASQAREVIRVINLATACASVFGTNELGLEEINDHFLRIFVPENQEVSRDAADLYLGLKTQIFLAVLETGGMAKDQLLEDLFIARLENSLQEHHPDLPLSIIEYEFIANAKARKAMLFNESGDIDSIQALSKQFTYEAFLDGLSTFLNDHIESIRVQGTGKVETTTVIEDITQNDHIDHDHGLDDTFDLNAMIAEASRAAQSALEPDGEVPNLNESHELDELSAFLAENVSKAVEQAKGSTTELPSAIASAAESASRATMLALQSIQQNQYQPTSLPQSTTPSHSTASHNNYQQHQQIQQQQAQQSQSQQQYYHYQQHPQNTGATTYQTTNDHLPPNQTDSTPALYERARQAAAARSSTHARREGSHSTRRPWSPEEEKALMMGLDMVKGPHWSQILSLFGPNGSISNILADRTQVQLKDKARNLKLFFLKTNSEMPYYLQCVTGELKTRAPTQAARKEAEEKARLNSEEQQAHVNGILTLAGGLQNNSVSRQSPSTTVPRSATPNQPLSHPNSQPGTPSFTQQHIQPSAPTPTPLSRPVIPAPQPVSLPTFTSSAHQHTPPPPIPQAEQQILPATTTAMPSATGLISNPVASTAPMSVTYPETAPVVESIEPERSEMSSVDAAVLNLGAALLRERERERESAAASDLNNAEEGYIPSNTASATPAATSTQ